MTKSCRSRPDSVRVYGKVNVYDKALERIRWLYGEFPNVVCCVSGGKDSTVVFHLCLQVARELNRLPLTVMWIDQEGEWQATVDTVREMMYDPDVEPMWMQVPIRLFNATSVTDHWLDCWAPEREADWVHPRDPVASTENVYGTDRFKPLFNEIMAVHFYDEPTVRIGGMRTEESPLRNVALAGPVAWKWATWGMQSSHPKLDHPIMYPIYDWAYTDVWKAINENGWPYNHIYDLQYRHGIQPMAMRVSNVHHETAVHALFYMQEAEPETYQRLVNRIGGIDMAGKMGADDYFVSTLPPMFESWREYRDYLLDNLITSPDWHACFRVFFDDFDTWAGGVLRDRDYRVMVQAILTNDWEGIKLKTLRADGDLRRMVRQSKQKEATPA